jgi:DNA-binding protein HU-beta
MPIQRAELAARIAAESGVTAAEADAVLAALTPVLSAALAKGESVRLTGLMSISTSERPARTGRNPRTGEQITIPAGRVVRIAPGATLKAAVK